ncbi:MAG: SAP domain-containing protein [Bacteroidota bacterium]|nr:SAP domain-containing protein [Bacteroidota bacterium]
MSLEEFDNGYFYAADLKVFAREIGITVGNFRKFELEELIREFLRTGKVPDYKPVMPRRAGGARDELKPDSVVTNYVGDRRTKDFLLKLVHAKVPDLGSKSGQWFWLNDWRRKMQGAQERFTYRDMADHLRALMQNDGRLPRIPSGRMINFITDFWADPANAGIPRKEVLDAWMWLKVQPGPETYAQYRRLTSSETPDDPG